GDNLEATLAAYGSGAVARSIRERATVMNVDVGGGTAKIAVCAGGKVGDHTAVDIGARRVCLDAAGRIARVEPAGLRFGAALGIELVPGRPLPPEHVRGLAARMADDLFAPMRGASPAADGRGLLRLDPLRWRGPIDEITFSGGVAEYVYS